MKSFLGRAKYIFGLLIVLTVSLSNLLAIAPPQHVSALNGDGCPDNQVNYQNTCRTATAPTNGVCPPRTTPDPDNPSVCMGPVVGKPTPGGGGGGGGGDCPGIISPGTKIDCSTIPAGCPGSLVNGPFDPSKTIGPCPYPPADTSWKCPVKSCSFKNGPTVSLNQTYDDAQAAGGPGKGDPTGCDFNGDPLTFLVCPIVKSLESGIQLVDNFITSALRFDTCAVFEPNCSEKNSSGNPVYQKGYYQAFSSFRSIALAVLIIAALIMVSSQALGFEFLDAYTMKKTLPRLLVAGIALILAWPLMEFAIAFFNAFGDGVRGLIYAPFADIKGTLGASTLFVFGAGFAILFAAMGPAILLYLLTAMLAVLVGFLIIMVRYLAILVLIIFAPVAIVCYVLPNTQKVWNLWRENFIGMLLVYPIISAFIAIGHVFSAVSIGGFGPGTFLSGTAMQAIGFIAYFLPYFLLPIAFRLATGVIGTLAGFVNDRHRGAFDRLKKGRGSAMANRHQARMNEQMSRGRLGNVYRRLGAVTQPQSGALSMTRQGRANYAEFQRKQRLGRVDEAMRADGGRAAGDDLATSLAVQRGMNRNRFLNDYQTGRRAQIQRDLNAGNITAAEAAAQTDRVSNDANDALALLERGFGAQMGSGAMRVAAFKARASSTTAFTGDEAGTAQRFNEGAALINDGLMTAADATAAGKGNRGRTDISGAGFGTQMTAFNNTAASLRTGGPGMEVGHNAMNRGAADHLRNTLQEADPGDILAGNTRTISALAPVMMENLQTHITTRQAAADVGDVAAYRAADLQVNRALGQIAGIQDNLNRTSPQKAGMFADQVNGVEMIRADGSRQTVRAMVDEASTRDPNHEGTQTFLDVRKEYSSRRLTPAQAAAAGAAAADVGGGDEER